MMKLAVVLSVLLVQAFAMTTVPHHTHHHTDHHHTSHHGHHTDQHHTGHHGHHTGHTHEPLEHENFNFKYDPHSMMMVAMVNHKCYLMTLSGHETTEVHTSHGLHTLELKMITAIDDTRVTHPMMTLHDLMAASKMLAHSCQHAKAIMRLN